MSLFISSLNSGSNGNCYYVGNDNEAILVDAGISCKEIEKRIVRSGLHMNKIKAVFVSHEHSDHIRGICTLSKKYKLPIYITAPTLLNCGFVLEEGLVRSFKANEPVIIGSLVITAFHKYHDACDPYSFIVECDNTRVGVFTDLGIPCANLVNYFKQCHAAFLEANYDEEMLDKGNYPYHLKRRIRGGNGHLSNKQALELFVKHKPPYMSHLFLAHLSKNNNCPDLVSKLFNQYCEKVKIVVASRYEETPVYTISNSVKPIKKIERPQLSFDFC